MSDLQQPRHISTPPIGEESRRRQTRPLTEVLRPSALKKPRKPHHWSGARPPRHQALPDYRCRPRALEGGVSWERSHSHRPRCHRSILPRIAKSSTSKAFTADLPVRAARRWRCSVVTQPDHSDPVGFAQYHGSGSQQSLNTLASGPPAFPFAT